MENTESKEENLDEKEKLAEAGQQRQKAPQDTVVHISELRCKHGEGDGGRNARERKVRGTEIHGGKQERVEISERNPETRSREEEKGEKKVLNLLKHQLGNGKQRNVCYRIIIEL